MASFTAHHTVHQHCSTTHTDRAHGHRHSDRHPQTGRQPPPGGQGHKCTGAGNKHHNRWCPQTTTQWQSCTRESKEKFWQEKCLGKASSPDFPHIRLKNLQGRAVPVQPRTRVFSHRYWEGVAQREKDEQAVAVHSSDDDVEVRWWWWWW